MAAACIALSVLALEPLTITYHEVTPGRRVGPLIASCPGDDLSCHRRQLQGPTPFRRLSEGGKGGGTGAPPEGEGTMEEEDIYLG